jgi:hypothetical protein
MKMQACNIGTSDLLRYEPSLIHVENAEGFSFFYRLNQPYDLSSFVSAPAAQILLRGT